MSDNINDFEKFQALQKQIADCRACESEFGFEPHPVLFGKPNAKIVQISQAPSLTVHKTGLPFNDASGRRLRSEWYKISDETFYNPDNFYIVSIAHCYPGKNPKGGDKRPPKSCADRWLNRELELVHNKIYLLVGGYAAQYFFPKEKLTDLVFKDLTINGKPAYILPHPSPINMNCFRDNPEFMKYRVPEIAKAVHSALDIP